MHVETYGLFSLIICECAILVSYSITRASSLGVPKLNRPELETACEDFSNIITTHDGLATIYKGTLSSGVEIAVASTAIASATAWSKRVEVAFRKKVRDVKGLSFLKFYHF